ncbi:MAG: TIGR04283 family arsenosugar biosynthesis glycosyltransferase [Verrucomicrobiae bacterium]|nr:TIGR04283 family arsenosugar biosynthesis glycosyltransferase [Verrucomicrobiae bacterium]
MEGLKTRGRGDGAAVGATGRMRGWRGSRRWRWGIRLAAVGGSALVLGWVLGRLEMGQLRETFQGLRPGWYAAAAGVFGLGMLGAAIRWHLMLRLNHEAVVHGAASVRMVFISQFFNTVLGGPSSGDIPKTALYARWFGVPAADVWAASVLDRLVATAGGVIFAGLAVMLGLAVGAFDFVGDWEWRMPARWVWGGGLGAMAVAVGLAVWLRVRPESFLGRAFRALGESGRRLLGSGRRSGHALLCAVLTVVMFNLTQALCLQAVSPEPVPWMRLFWMFHVVTMVASLPVTVAGTGLREGASMVLLGQYGVAPATAVAGAMLTLTIHLGWAGVGAVLWWREQRLRRRVTRGAPVRRISAVIPTWNEAANLEATVAHLRAIPEICEVLVSDGGSTDGTCELALRLGCRVLKGAKGRGQQMRLGAAAATGDAVVLVHADTWLGPGAGRAMVRCLRDPLVVGGGFWKRFRDAPWLMRGSRVRCGLRLWWGGRILGDQGMFVRRSVLEAVGGVPEQPLMEEIELCRRLRRVGRLALAGAGVSTSARRFTGRGVLRTYWLMGRVSWDYRRGVPPEELARRYEGGGCDAGLERRKPG